MNRWTRVLAALAALVLFAGACGSDDVDTTPISSGAIDEAVTSSDDDAMEEDGAEEDAMAEDAEAMEEEAMEEDGAEEEAMEEDGAEEDAMAEDAEAMEEEAAEEEAMEDEAMAEDAMSDAFPVAVADITIESQPIKIVSLSPTATEMLFAIGAGDQVIAADDFSNYPAEAPTTDLSGYQPNVEAIGGYAPDLIVAQGPIEGVDALGVPVLVQFAAASFDDVYTQIEQLGAATGHVAGAAELVLNMQTEIDTIIADLPENAAGLTYYHELDNTLYSVTSSTFIGSVYSLLGLENIADASDPDGEAFGYPQLTEESVVASDPDLIFLADTKCCGQDATTIAQRAGWDQLRAVQAGNVIELDDDIASRWGPRLVDFIRAVADAVGAVELADS